MSLVTGLAIYFIIWWITLFMVLPFGIERERNVEEGNDPGAPIRHRMLIKIAINTIFAFIIWSIVFVIDMYDIITMRDLFSSNATGN